jgi:MYXO-CTERM domain-containing protein
MPTPQPQPPMPPPSPMMNESFVLTRLHARYSKDGISEDLVFTAAKSIAGGREWRGQDGKLEEGSIDYGVNNFQARYAIRHEWTGPIACSDPLRGVWGGPPEGSQQVAQGPTAATDLAFVPRGQTKLAQIVRQDVPEIDVKADRSADPAQPQQPAKQGGGDGTTFKPKKEKEGCAVGGGGGAWWLAALALGLLALRRRRR